MQFSSESTNPALGLARVEGRAVPGSLERHRWPIEDKALDLDLEGWTKLKLQDVGKEEGHFHQKELCK